MDLRKIFLQKNPINWATRKFKVFQVLQFISVILKNFKNIERNNSQGFEFTMFSLVFPLRIPFEHQASQLEILFLYLLVKILLDLLLMALFFIKELLPYMMYFYYLMHPSDHII